MYINIMCDFKLFKKTQSFITLAFIKRQGDSCGRWPLFKAFVIILCKVVDCNAVHFKINWQVLQAIHSHSR